MVQIIVHDERKIKLYLIRCTNKINFLEGSIIKRYIALMQDNTDIDKQTIIQILKHTIGLDIKILSNDYKEKEIKEYNQIYTFQTIVFQIKEEEPDDYAFDVLFTLSLLSFTYASPMGYSKKEFKPDDEWQLGYFIQGLKYEYGNLSYSGDYIAGRMVKTDITYEKGGKVILITHNRGKGAERWLANLQGKRYYVV